MLQLHHFVYFASLVKMRLAFLFHESTALYYRFLPPAGYFFQSKKVTKMLFYRLNSAVHC